VPGLRGTPGASVEAAIAQAARDTLVALFPSQAASFDDALAKDLAALAADRTRSLGTDIGRQAATAVLRLRQGDGSEIPEPGFALFAGTAPGQWQQDPISQGALALGAYWGDVTPFVLPSGDHFRVVAPPTLNSAEYATAFYEVMGVGGDGAITPTQRTAEQTQIGIFWAYDGTPSLCAPPRLYNQITMKIAEQMHTNAADIARLLALVNTAMADTGIAVWESKYYYELWRPVTAMRNSMDSMGRSAAEKTMMETFTPMGAPASNLVGPNFTPPFPAYPSGHAGFGGALFQTLRRFYGRDDIAFTFTSDEFNGITVDHEGNVRPVVTRSYASLSQAEDENGQSRIYLGIHWRFDKTQGIAQGRKVADYVFDHAFGPARGNSN
jgi:hypothetical protein